MKLYSIYLIVGLMAPLACSAEQKSGAGKPITIVISDEAFRRSNAHPSKEVVLVPGDTLVIELGSNPTTGRWTEKPANSNPRVLKQERHEYIQRGGKGPSGRPMVGAGGVETWTFKAAKNGEVTLDFACGFPWLGGEKATWTLKVIAKVSPAQQ